MRDEVLSRDDIDACASITLRLGVDSTIRVEVALPDGRAASRDALRQEDVIPILQALLLVPEPVPVLPAPTRSPMTGSLGEPARARPRAAAGRTGDSAGSSGSSLPGRTGGLGVELSLVSGARFGDGQVSYGLGAQSFLDVNSWLVGFAGRADRYYQLADAQAQTALELGVVAGKRLRFGGVTVDLTAGPGFAIKGALASQTEVAVVQGASGEPPPSAPQRSPPPEPSSGAVPRLLAGAHLGFSPSSVLRSFVGVDGTFGSARAEGLSPYSPGMPRWTLGLTLGATVGTP
ncbi:MAG TPA: hypothetical protein VFK05_09865 [Polyangiaceae bacterium]|nr:hypothetical protein [Polyangiaceae bacterium]